ncbi:MAG: LytTR family DNA-binding domain-containing protein [Clostridium sp.]|nr:LytTR family DNA-binding domain-containing protein [Clostridium sp.]
MIHILLCDDEEKVLDRTKKYIDSIRRELKYEIEIKTYADAESVLRRVRNSGESSDILITDIDMPDLSGMEMVQILRDEGVNMILIFMTAHAEYVFQSFEYFPFRYIRKEFMETELLPALQAACEKVHAERDISLSIKTQDGILAVRTCDILYYELENRKCVIYTIQNKQYETWKRISELREEMGEMDSSFLQIYRGCMVNKKFVKTIKKDRIVLENGIELPISRRKKQEISDAMMEYWGEII